MIAIFNRQFQPTLPARGATPPDDGWTRNQPFQPTLPARGATRLHRWRRTHKPFQPTLPARGATIRRLPRAKRQEISTHAPRTGSDENVMPDVAGLLTFQPTLPARGATRPSAPRGASFIVFQPTLPARGATCSRRSLIPAAEDFNPRSPHGERPAEKILEEMEKDISTHAPRTGSDTL